MVISPSMGSHVVNTISFLTAATIFASTLGCSSSRDPLQFADDFEFGVAIAGFQVDMGCPSLPDAECLDPNSDWYEFTTSEDLIADPTTFLVGHTPDLGPGHWELYENDFDLASEGLSATRLRTSIEWSRIFPTATDDLEGYEQLLEAANSDALEVYHDMFAAMRARGLTPLVTLNHYTLPNWIHDAVGCHQDVENCSPRGWLDSERTIREVAKYAGFVAREFGDDVDQWVTLNEPLAVVLPGYLQPSADRSNPPAVSLEFEHAKTVVAALIEAHARMYDAVKENDQQDADGDGIAARIGLVKAVAPIHPKDENDDKDIQGAANIFYLQNTAFLNAVALGLFDGDLDGVGEPRDDLMNRMDYLGINYYARALVQGSDVSAFPEFSELFTINPFSFILDEDYPRGIYEAVLFVHTTYDLPIVISENGVLALFEDATDEVSTSSLVRTLSWLSKAIDEGADVEAYFYWTLMDLFEWNLGMTVHMGLYAVDENDPNKTRQRRPFADTFQRIAGEKKIPTDLLDRFPIAD